MLTKKDKEKRWLITIDLDGTLISNGNEKTETDEYTISEKNIKSIQKCIDLGHKVAIVTGRPWRNTKTIYEKINLHTIVGNYNGAHIHHPHDVGFSEIKTAMNRKNFRRILDIDLVKKTLKNFIIEFDDATYMYDTKDKKMRALFHIEDKEHSNLLQCGLDFLPHKDPFVMAFRFDYSKTDRYTLITTLKRKFGQALNFRYWINDYRKTLCMEVNQKFISKAYAMNFIASYYNIPQSQTIAFGDGENDVEMLNTAELGVAMKNSTDLVKSYARDVTDYNNYEDGVGKYLDKFFKKEN
ncbi:MAG: hypothetical protein HPAVJP_4490 [Candidatus Hepatoplasma vulgare]|nr:MAG: hypothetical protein HPAVJP_4490 [Candidatus Hepatoplasma sp.]